MIYRPYELYQSFSNFVPPMGLDIWLKFYGHPSSSVQDFRGMLLPPPLYMPLSYLKKQMPLIVEGFMGGIQLPL